MTATTLPTAQDVVREVRKIATLFPDYIYQAEYGEYRYFERTSPIADTPTSSCGCIVGHGLAAVGLGPDDVAEMMSADREIGHLANSHRIAHPDRESATSLDEFHGAKVWLRTVQSWQDRGHPWGRAAKMADAGLLPPDRGEAVRAADEHMTGLDDLLRAR